MMASNGPRRRPAWRTPWLGAGLFALLLSGAASAQVLPDNLDGGPCCTQVDPILPAFPKIKMEALEVCWLDCDVDNVLKCRMTMSPPVMMPGGTVQCGRYQSNLRLVEPGTGVLKWRGRSFLTYSRTWFESDGVSQRFQVWRFLVHCDLKPTSAAGSAPCPVPDCVSSFGKIRVTGYVDYALELASNTWFHTWMVHHSCDGVDHVPGFPRGGAFHPDRTYTFVGPSASFAISNVQPFEGGTSTFEDMRRSIVPSAGQPDTLCEYEEGVASSLDPLQDFCFCGSPNGPPQYTLAALNAGGNCGTQISTPGGPFLPGYLTMGIGMWTDVTRYPGLEIVKWNTGGYDRVDPCTGNVRSEVYFGVSTIRGYDAFQVISSGIGADLKENFVDQGNSIWRADGLSTIMNIRYVSDHILNLNY